MLFCNSINDDNDHDNENQDINCKYNQNINISESAITIGSIWDVATQVTRQIVSIDSSTVGTHDAILVANGNNDNDTADGASMEVHRPQSMDKFSCNQNEL